MPDALHGGTWHRRGEANEPVLIFVHGLDSSSEQCWLNRAGSQPVYWPDLIATEPSLGRCGLFLVDYHSKSSDGSGISERATELHAALSADPESPLRARTLVFVCHSLGGILVRKILVDHWEDFREKTVRLCLLASPSTGDGLPKWLVRPLLWARSWVKDVSLELQLTVQLDLIRELDVQFRRLLNPNDLRYLPQLQGAERSESLSLAGLPLLGRVVDRFSSQRYFPEPQELSREDHGSICKPATRNAPVHVLVRQMAEAVRGNSEPPRKAPVAFETLVRCLEADFGFRYEPAPGSTGDDPSVFWPVRLRYPSAIHAQQSFVAAALTRLGLSVELWLDDLGNQDYTPEFMKSRLMQWFQCVNGNVELIKIRSFIEELQGSEARHEAWLLAQQWLGNTEERLDVVLRLSKLLPKVGNGDPFQALLKKRPRRLLTPPVVWMGLRLMARRCGPILTLGGLDEVDLWGTWRDLGIDSQVRAGHLYAAWVKSPGSDSGQPLHMASTPLKWHSYDDILKSLREAQRVKDDPNTLLAWCVQQCVFLPQTIAGDWPQLTVGQNICRTLSEVLNVEPESRVKAVARALQERLLP